MVLMPLNLPQLSDSSACSPHQSFLPVETECHLPGTISSRPKQGKEKSQTPCILRCTPSRLQRASEKNRCRAGSEKPEVWLCDGLLHTCEQVTSVILLLLQSPHAWYKRTEEQLPPSPEDPPSHELSSLKSQRAAACAGAPAALGFLRMS
ncbi:uncharacterized protein LOC134513396 isoform X3 [Chroicocephalus ridibundus]|uniref:uncharacterized protein LOC134513396 isoform X3 n=1 Tax=Chroicocephalus ridibundus TaxID=1192867 RepID=UPI002FDEDE78